MAGAGGGPSGAATEPVAGHLDHDHLDREHHAAVARLATLALRYDTTLADLVREAIEELVRLVPCTSAAILMAHGDELEVRVASDPTVEGRRHPLSGSLCERALEDGGVATADPVAPHALPGLSLIEGQPAGPAWAVVLGASGRQRVLVCLGAPEARANPTAAASIEAIATVLAGLTERRAIEAELRSTDDRFRQLADHVPDAVFRLRILPTRRMEYVNPHLAELSGMTTVELLADPWAWRELVPDEDLSAFAPVYDLAGDEAAGDEVVTTAPYRIVRRDGTIRWAETRVAPERDADGQLIAIAGITRDITTRREAEATLQRALDLEKEASEQLRDLAELKNALLAAVSHELRTPLTAVIGFAEFLRTAGDTLEPERRDRALDALERNARRLEHLMTDLLDLDRLDRGVVEPLRRPVDLPNMITGILERLDTRSLPISVEVPPRIIDVDAAKIERALENLIANAVKHTPHGSRVFIRSEEHEGGVRVAVEDDGPGIPNELKSLVFEPFERGRATSPAPGTGIGLSLVRRFVELHGGRAWVEDRVGGGSAFVVWLPDVAEGGDSSA